ncbi:Ankyrin repeat-containing protein [Camellia lanceoleosa]|nr:Ankyrin repeat-containing protein [Camellia lanceoleosa]
MEGFVGNGALKRVIPKLIEEGWDDVPTLKLMKLEDMDAINMTQQQKDALEMRSYLHNRALIQYGDKLESSGKCLQELLGLSADEISSQFGMKRGHVARFIEKKTSNSSIPDRLQQPPQALTSSKRITKTSSNNSIHKKKLDQSTKILLELKRDLIKETDEDGWTPFHYAACFGNEDGVKLMLEIDKSVAYITTGEKGDEKTALHIAAANGRQRVMEKILSECPDCWEMVNSEGKNVLHIAVDAQQEEVIEYIFKKSWIIHLINQKDIEANTPLHLLATFSMLKLMGKLRSHFSRDKWNATNNKNMTPQDILSSCSEIQDNIIGRNIMNQNQELAKITREKSEKRGAQSKERMKAMNEEWKKVGDTHMIVATLIAAITFAAGFTMPGGYNSNEGSNQGMPLLLREAAFKVFVITNTIAVICSTSSAFLYVTASLYYVQHKDDVEKPMKRYLMALLLILIAVAAMIVAFITGSFAMLAHSLGLVISVCLISCISFLIYFIELKKFISHI